MRHNLDESPHPGPNKPKGGRSGHPGFNQNPSVTDWEPTQIKALRSALALLRFFASPGSSPSYEARVTARLVDAPEPDTHHKQYREFLDDVLREIDVMTNRIVQACKGKQAPVVPGQCSGCGSGFARGSVFCSKCGRKISADEQPSNKGFR